MFSFDQWSTVKSKDSWTGEMKNNPYELPVEKEDKDDTEDGRFWKTASNRGYLLAGTFSGGKLPVEKPSDFPVQKLVEANKGTGLLLQTNAGFLLSIGSLKMGSEIVPGSLYNGLLDATKMSSKPLESTLFGTEFQKKPYKIKGFYKYKAGDKYIDGSKGPDAIVPGKDQGIIAGVFYEITDDQTYLNGKTLYDDKRIISMVRLFADDTSGDKWKKFDIEFNTVNQAAFDAIDFTKKKYRLAIVISSSANGDKFQGAVGSQFKVDQLEVLTQK